MRFASRGEPRDLIIASGEPAMNHKLFCDLRSTNRMTHMIFSVIDTPREQISARNTLYPSIMI